MANTAKKYYWLKLKEDFFDDDTIEWIEDQQNGSTYALFYLKLCLKSLKTNGVLIRNVGDMLIPYDAKKLAEITRTDVDTVRVAMDLFQKIGLIQILENGEIFLSQLENMVGSESKWAEKKRLQRAKKAEALPTADSKALQCNTDEINGNTEIEKRDREELTNRQKDNVLNVSEKSPREIEKEKEKDIEKELTDRLTELQMERVELLKELFAGWSVSNYQIYYLSTLINDLLPYEPDSAMPRDIRIYHNLERLILQARADKVQHIYRWLIKMIPLADIY